MSCIERQELEGPYITILALAPRRCHPPHTATALPPSLPPRRDFAIVSYTLLLSMIEFKTLVAREDLEGAMTLLPR